MKKQETLRPGSGQAETTRQFVVLDRDGVVIEDQDHLTDPAGVVLIHGAARAIRKMRDLGFGLVVVTNQSVIGRGWLDQAGLGRIHGRMTDLLKQDGAHLDGIFVCPHTADDSCTCRKPAIGLMEQAARAHQFDPRESFVVGDKTSDIEFGKRAGATTILVRSGYGREVEAEGKHGADYVADDLPAAVAIISRHGNA